MKTIKRDDRIFLSTDEPPCFPLFAVFEYSSRSWKLHVIGSVSDL